MRYTLTVLAAVAVVQASPFAFPQGVTALVSPTAAPAPGCTPSFSGSFGIAVMNVSTAGPKQRREAQVTQIADGQPQADQPITQIGDGQIQAATTMMHPVSQIIDGQVQAPTHAPAVSQIPDGQVQATTAPAASQMSDGRPVATSAAPVTTTPALSSTSRAPSTMVTTSKPSSSSTAPPASSSSSSSSSSGSSKPVLVACQTNSTLALTLTGGVLKDAKGRIGYVASNYQFQFDAPPQAGAIFTSGFSVCGNGSLALGGSSVFWQCRSGNFFNLYDRYWAAQCSPVNINVLTLQQCS